MKKFTAILPDALLVAGGGCASYGAGLLLPAAGFIVAGCLLLGFGFLTARASK